MGYQESWIILQPQSQLKKVLELAKSAENKRVSLAEVYGVITLKRSLPGIARKGTRILWIGGERGANSLRGIIAGEKHPLVTNKCIPMEYVIGENPDLLKGFAMPIDPNNGIQENATIKYCPAKVFLAMQRDKGMER